MPIPVTTVGCSMEVANMGLIFSVKGIGNIVASLWMSHFLVLIYNFYAFNFIPSTYLIPIPTLFLPIYTQHHKVTVSSNRISVFKKKIQWS